jgi:ankyrin repeat protein
MNRFIHFCIKGDLEEVKLLFDDTINVNDALRVTKDLKVVKFLVKKGADVNAFDGAPLFKACLYGNFEVVKFLVENGANIHLDDDIALRHACVQNRLDIVKYLVEHGANIHIFNDFLLKVPTHPEINNYLINQLLLKKINNL